jgi:hypothetical protein
MVGEPQSSLRLCNESTEMLEVVLEPYGRDYWLNPGERW